MSFENELKEKLGAHNPEEVIKKIKIIFIFRLKN